MAIILEANYSKKLGLPGYSSHQYSVTVRTELSDLAQVEAESKRLYELLQFSVDCELQHTGYLPGSSEKPAARNDSPCPDGWCCSEKQRDLILKIVEEHQLDKHVVEQIAHDRFNKAVRQLNRQEASGLIDTMLAQPMEGAQFNGLRRANGPYQNGRAR